MKRLKLDGMVFGKLTILSCDGPGPEGAIWWTARCECGNMKSARGADLKRGFVVSCGCWNSHVLSERCTTHGWSKTRIYRIWQAMKDRTGNPAASRYSYYGGRGIKLCDEWFEFTVFRDWALANGYSDKLSIDRIDNDGNYESTNCRWADQRTQVLNRRKMKRNTA
jgi:hypothetical protein